MWSPHERKEEIERVGEEGERQETSSRLYHGNKASIGRINWIHSRPGVYTSLTVHSTLYAPARFSISGGTASPSFFLYRHSGAEHSGTYIPIYTAQARRNERIGLCSNSSSNNNRSIRFPRGEENPARSISRLTARAK